jgi:hypothetical protein
MIEVKTNNNKTTFGSEVGGGIGCLFFAIAVVILLSYDKIIDLIAKGCIK